MSPPPISIRPHLLARIVVILSFLTIITALLLTHFNPKRFRIHPYPYLSDAGLRDPERIILTIGLALCAALFVPVVIALYLTQQAHLHSLRTSGSRPPYLSLILHNSKSKRRIRIPQSLPCDTLPLWGFRAGLVLALFLALFTAVPGYWYLHHIFALIFAISSAVWCLCHTLILHARWQSESGDGARRVGSRVKVMYALIGIIAMVVVFFGIIWATVKLRRPPMIPNKDVRFIYLAFLEYVGTSSFLIFISMVSNELNTERIHLSLQSPLEVKLRDESLFSKV